MEFKISFKPVRILRAECWFVVDQGKDVLAIDVERRERENSGGCRACSASRPIHIAALIPVLEGRCRGLGGEVGQMAARDAEIGRDAGKNLIKNAGAPIEWRIGSPVVYGPGRNT